MIQIRNDPALQRWAGDGWVNIGGQVIATVDADSLVTADLREWKLEWADFTGADLRGADLAGADLNCALFCNAALRAASLIGTMVWCTRFHGTLLEGADFTDATLVGAQLQGVDLRGAILQNTILRYAVYDEATLWPPGNDPQEVGARLPSQVRAWKL